MDIAVVAFRNLTGEHSLDYLTVAIPNLLITSLEGNERLSVITWERMYDLAEAAGKDVELIDDDIGFEICRKHGIETIVLGSFTKADDVFATDAKVLDVKTKKLLKSATSKGTGTASILNIQIDELSNIISLGIGVPEANVRESQTRICDLTTSSMEAYAHFLEGREYRIKHRLTDAKHHLERAVELDSTFAVAHLYLAWTQFDLNEIPASSESFEKAKRFSQKTTEKERLYIEASYGWYVEDNNEKYSRSLNIIAQKYPKEKRAHNRLGWFYRQLWLFDEAIAAFNIALEIDPNYGSALLGMTYTYTDMKEYSQAIGYLKRYAAIYPDEANTFDTMADLYFFMGNLDEAIASYKKALEIRPIFVISAMKMSFVYALKEEYTKAMKWCDYYITMAPSPGVEGSGYGMKAFFHYWLGNFSQWQSDYRKMLDLHEATGFKSGIYSMELLRGAVFYEIGDFKQSRNYFELYIDSINVYEPSYAAWRTAYCNSIIGMVDLEEQQYESARTRLSVIKSLIPKVWESGKDWLAFRHDLLYAELLLRVDSLEKAIDVCKNISQQPPDVNQRVIIFANITLPGDVLARVYQRKGEIDSAIAEYERLMKYDIVNGQWHLINPKYHYRLAQLYEKKGQYAKAAAEYRKVIDIWKDTDMYVDELQNAKKRLKLLTNKKL